MNTSYADAIRLRGEGRQSPPSCNANRHPLTAPIGAPTLISRDQTKGSNVANMETALMASSLTSQIQKLVPSINPTKPSEGESLLEGYARNYTGFLIKTNKKRIPIFEELVATEERFLQDHPIVASFIGGRPSPFGFTTWLSKLNLEISGSSISYNGDLGWGFTCLKDSNQNVARQALVLTPCRIGSFLCIFQQWTPLFDPSSSRGMLIPTWITLKKLPLQFFGVAQEIVASLGKVLEKDAQNYYFKDPRFCIALDTSLGWKSELEIKDRFIGKLIPILVDYTNLPICCRYCNDFNHQTRACPQRNGSMRQAKQDTKSHPSMPVNLLPPEVPPYNNNKTIVDEEGFISTSKHRRQDALRRPLEIHTLQDAEKLAPEQDVSMLRQSPHNNLQKSLSLLPHPPAHPAPNGNHSNYLSASQIPQASQKPSDTTKIGMATSHKQPSSNLPSQDCINLVGSYDTSSCISQPRIRPRMHLLRKRLPRTT